MSWRSLLLVTAGLALSRSASAQTLLDTLNNDSIMKQPVTSAGSSLIHWTNDDGPSEQTIYIRNTSKDRIVEVSSWEIYNCDNIRRRDCGQHDHGPRIKPGQTVRLQAVFADDETRGYRYSYRLKASYVETAPPATH